jgi:glycine dehydrogenase subunit 2
MLIEPTESVGRQELDQFIDAMRSIAKEAVESPELGSQRTTQHKNRKVR